MKQDVNNRQGNEPRMLPDQCCSSKEYLKYLIMLQISRVSALIKIFTGFQFLC